MKKIVTAVMVVLAMASLAGCVGYGKGKAPAPVVTNG
jgi:predicted small lipoprotein YifL